MLLSLGSSVVDAGPNIVKVLKIDTSSDDDVNLIGSVVKKVKIDSSGDATVDSLPLLQLKESEK